jgi:hypothetical protein
VVANVRQNIAPARREIPSMMYFFGPVLRATYPYRTRERGKDMLPARAWLVFKLRTKTGRRAESGRG